MEAPSKRKVLLYIYKQRSAIMKKWISLLLCAALVTAAMLCAAAPASADGVKAASDAFRLSSVSDVTDENGGRVYRVYAPYTDTYSLSASGAASIAIYENGKVLAQGNASLTVDLTENAVYTLEVKTAQGNAAFSVTTKAQNHLVTLPYKVAEPVDASAFPLQSDGADPLAPAEIRYQKRGGGTYIYSNNPEAIRADAVGKAFIRSEGLTGEVYVTFEHANYSGTPIYLGYQLKNEGDTDVYITVTNVGYQAEGTWFGQKAWYDFYNVSFDLPSDYFSNPGKYFADYAFQKYTPRVFQPITYRLPAGEYFYVIGGTSEDAYQHISVDNSADRAINSIRCANGNVKFTVTGGSVTGTLYAYKDIAQVKAEPASLGYVTGEYARQYSGRAEHAGVIDNYVTWTFSDETADRALPVTYTNFYDSNRPAETTPYAAYNSTSHTVKSTVWLTHLNPQNDHRAVGMDMVEFPYYDQTGKPVLVGNDHADGVGKPANIGNWMIEYQDHFTFVNQGDDERLVTLTMQDNGALATLVRDSATGEILQADLTAGINLYTPNYAYTVAVPAHSVKQITLDYVLLACSYGSVLHTASLSRVAVEPETPDLTLGDLSGNGKIDSTDYMLLKRAVLGTGKLTDGQKAVADLNKDGEINSTDYILLKRAVLGTYIIR